MNNAFRRKRRPQKMVGRLLRKVFLEPFYFLGFVGEQVVNRVFRRSQHTTRRKRPSPAVPTKCESSAAPAQECSPTAKTPRKSRASESAIAPQRSVLGSICFWLGYPFFVLWQWIQNIGTGGDRRAFLLGLPALLIGVGCVALIVAAANIPKSQLVRRYELAAIQAFGEEQLSEAATYYEKLCNLEPSEDRFRFMLGLIAAKEDDLPRAIGIMNQLAPFDRQGYGRAHLWIAKQQLEQLERRQIDDPDDYLKTQDAVQRHLQFAIRDNDRLWEAKYLLGQLLLRSDPGRAEELLSQVTDDEPRAAMVLASLQRERGNETGAEETLQNYLPKLKEDIFRPDLARNERITLIDEYLRCLIMLERFAEAEDFAGSQKTVLGTEILNIEYSKIHYAQAAAELRRPVDERNLSRVVGHLDSSLQFYSGNVAALRLLTDLLQKDIGEQRHIVDLLLDTVVENRATAITFLVLGNYHSRKGDSALALRYYNDASSRVKDPRLLGSIYNNIAWLYLQQEPPAADDTLEWIAKAFELGVDLPEYHDTRGQALAIKNDWSAAREDLQLALSGLNQLDRVTSSAEKSNLVRRLLPTLQAMIRCEEALGNQDMQQRYEQRLDEVRNLALELGVELGITEPAH